MHVNELVEELRRRFGRATDRDALSSALAKKARAGQLVRQTGKATFEAIPPEPPAMTAPRHGTAHPVADAPPASWICRPAGDSGASAGANGNWARCGPCG